MLRIDAESILCRHGWLSRQPHPFQRRWLSRAELRHHPAGEGLYAEGEAPGALSGLVEGSLSVLYQRTTRSSALIHVAQPGWWVGDVAAISDGPRRVTLAARHDSWVMHVELAAIRAMAAEEPEVWRRIAQITVGHLDHAMNVVASLTADDARARVAMALRRLVDLDGNRAAGNAMVRVTQKELCSMTRVSRNAIAPLLMDLEKTGVISRRYRRIEILDMRALTALLKQSRPSRIVSSISA